MEPESLAALVVVLALAQFSPGPDMLVLLKNGLNASRAAALWTVAGIATGLLAHTSLSLSGISLLLHHSPEIFEVVRLLGALYLGWLGLRLLAATWRRRPKAGANPVAGLLAMTGRAAYFEGLGTNLLNPKAFVFFVVIFTQLVPPEISAAGRAALVVLVVGEAAILWSVFVLFLGTARVRRAFFRREGLINAAFGVMLLTLALRVGLEAMRALAA
jgi:threonine/homoserine/homoserine lactone efflux protein